MSQTVPQVSETLTIGSALERSRPRRIQRGDAGHRPIALLPCFGCRIQHIELHRVVGDRVWCIGGQLGLALVLVLLDRGLPRIVPVWHQQHRENLSGVRFVAADGVYGQHPGVTGYLLEAVADLHVRRGDRALSDDHHEDDGGDGQQREDAAHQGDDQSPARLLRRSTVVAGRRRWRPVRHRGGWRVRALRWWRVRALRWWRVGALRWWRVGALRWRVGALRWLRIRALRWWRGIGTLGRLRIRSLRRFTVRRGIARRCGHPPTVASVT